MIGSIKEIFPPKTGMREKQLLQDPRYVGVVGEMHAALLHACRIFIVVVGASERVQITFCIIIRTI